MVVARRQSVVYPPPVESFEVVVDPSGNGDVLTIQDACNAIPAGKCGTIYLRAGTHNILSTIDVNDKSIRLVGAGTLVSGGGTVSGQVKIVIANTVTPAFRFLTTNLSGIISPFAVENVTIESWGGGTLFAINPAVVASNVGPDIELINCFCGAFAQGSAVIVSGRGFPRLRLTRTTILLASVANQKIIEAAVGADYQLGKLVLESQSKIGLDNASIGAIPVLDFVNPLDMTDVWVLDGSELNLHGGEQIGDFKVSSSMVFSGGGPYWSPVYVWRPDCVNSTFGGLRFDSFPTYGMVSPARFIGCDFYGGFAPSTVIAGAIVLTNPSDIVCVDGCYPSFDFPSSFSTGMFVVGVAGARFCTQDHCVIPATDYTGGEKTPSTVLADATAAPIGLTLPAPALFLNRIITVKKIDATVNAVTVTPAAGTIDGAASFVLTNPYESVQFISNGNNWYVLYCYDGASAAGLTTNISSVAADTVLNATYGTVLVSAAGAARTITLPNANTCRGRQYTVKKTDSSANAVNIASGGGTIDGVASAQIVQQNASLTFQSDGTNWWIV